MIIYTHRDDRDNYARTPLLPLLFSGAITPQIQETQEYPSTDREYRIYNILLYQSYINSLNMHRDFMWGTE